MMPFSADQRRVLAMLSAAGPDGVAQAILSAKGFDASMIAGVGQPGLATLITEEVWEGGEPSAVAIMRITEAGHRALATEDWESQLVGSRRDRWSFFHRAMALAWEGSAVTRRGELSHFYHVAVAADKMMGDKNYDGLHGFAETSSVAPRTYALRRDNLDFVVFCFAKSEDAQAFREQFGGERLVPHLPSSRQFGVGADPTFGNDRAQQERFLVGAPRRKRRPTDDERRVLELLAGNPHGATEEALVLGHGFKLQMLASLVRTKLAKRYHLTVTARGRTTGVTVTYLKITDAGRKSLREWRGADELTRPIHDRTPVVLDKADIGRWLNGEGGTELLKRAAEDRLRMWPVSRRVNKTGTGDDDPTLLDEVAAWCSTLFEAQPRRAVDRCSGALL
jgi:hypothetical protein